MRCPRSLVAVLTLLIQPSWVLGIAPPAGLCQVVAAMNGAANESQLKAYFTPSQGHAYESLTSELRAKLVESSVAMMSMPSENEGRRVFAGENWGTTAIAHLWLLGLTEAEIRSHVDTRVAPGVGVLSRGKDFRSPPEAIPDVKPKTKKKGPSITRVRNGQFLEGDRELAQALQLARDAAEIDSAFSETNPGILKYHFDGALLSANREMARKILDYMKMVGPESNETIYAIEVMGSSAELFEHGNSLHRQALRTYQELPLSTPFRLRLEGAIESLSRVTGAELKPKANEALLQIARLLESSSFRATFPKDDIEDHHTQYYDLALLALQGTGEVVSRRYVDSVRVELTFRFSAENKEVKELIGKITDHYLTFNKRLYYEQFHEVRRALLAAKDVERLKRFGRNLLSRAGEWEQEWWPFHPYWSAYEFFHAAQDGESCKLALNTLFKKFPLVDTFSRDDRNGIDPDSFSSWIDRMADLQDAQGLRILLDAAEKKGWEDTVEKIAEVQAGEAGTPDLFPHLPEIPNGIDSVLHEDSRTRAGNLGTPPDAAEKARLVEEGGALLQEGDVNGAWEKFRLARSSRGMTLIGDAYLKAHRNARHSRGPHFGATAHGAYFLAAIFEAEESGSTLPR